RNGYRDRHEKTLPLGYDWVDNQQWDAGKPGEEYGDARHSQTNRQPHQGGKAAQDEHRAVKPLPEYVRPELEIGPRQGRPGVRNVGPYEVVSKHVLNARPSTRPPQEGAACGGKKECAAARTSKQVTVSSGWPSCDPCDGGAAREEREAEAEEIG